MCFIELLIGMRKHLFWYCVIKRQLSAHKTHNQQDIIFNNLIFDLYSTGKAGCMDINLVN